MEHEVNEKRYPIETIYMLKSVTVSLFTFLIMSVLMMLGLDDVRIYFFISLAYVPGTIVYFFLWRKSFTYSLDAEFVTLGQGILGRQQRNIPYGVIQNILIKQDLFDRLFGTGTIIVENASANGAAEKPTTVFGLRVNQRTDQAEIAGFSGNRVLIPGLKISNAQALREAFLTKMKEHPVHDNESGL